ncbi:MAG: UMP kinase [Planctomycetota bacterium]|jgi:uridylate kinase
MADRPHHKRVVLKISGEALCSPGGFGVDADAVGAVVDELAAAARLGVQIAIVIGGGNFLRGRAMKDNPHVRRITADYMGMLATTMNALALRDALEAHGLDACVLGALPIEALVDAVDIRRADEYLSAGRIVILAGGTGRPFVTTDTCAALRACELQADAVLKGTKVDGVFDRDPEKHADAKQYDRLTYDKAIADQLGVMDLTAISLCRENELPIVVFQLAQSGALAGVLEGKDIGTVIDS